MKIRYLPHALERMEKRNISKKDIENALKNPDESFRNDIGNVAHKIYTNPLNGKKYLLRVFYEQEGEVTEIVSTYVTSKILKYFRGDLDED